MQQTSKPQLKIALFFFFFPFCSDLRKVSISEFFCRLINIIFLKKKNRRHAKLIQLKINNKKATKHCGQLTAPIIAVVRGRAFEPSRLVPARCTGHRQYQGLCLHGMEDNLVDSIVHLVHSRLRRGLHLLQGAYGRHCFWWALYACRTMHSHSGLLTIGGWSGVELAQSRLCPKVCTVR